MKALNKIVAFLMVLVILFPQGFIIKAVEAEQENKEAKVEEFEYPLKQEESKEKSEVSAPVINLPEISEDEDIYEERFGKPVETTEHTKVYQVDKTHFKTIVTSEKNTYEDASGKEQLIDNTLQEAKPRARSYNAAKEYVNKANDFKVRFPEKVTSGKGISITKDGTRLTLYPEEGNYANAGIKENAILYNQVFDGVDVQYTVESFGIKEDIILRKQVDRNQFSYVFDADGIEAKLEDQKVKIYRWDKKAPVFELSAPLMIDANGEACEDVKLNLEKEHGLYRMMVTANEDWLKRPERAYPVCIDPSIKIPSSKLEVVTTSTVHGTYQGAGYGYVGYITASMTGVAGARDIGKSRMYFKINEDFKKLIPEEGKINAATLNVYQYGRYSTTTATFACYRLEQNWDPSTLT